MGVKVLALIAFFRKTKKFFTGHTDPVKNCGFYKSLGCSHVDGPLCDFPRCSMFKEWYKNQRHEEI